MVHLFFPTAPYDLGKAREYLTMFEGVEPSPQKRTLIRSWMQPANGTLGRSTPTAVRLEDIGTIEHPQLEAELVVGDEGQWPQIEQMLVRSLSLGFDVAPLVRQARDDPEFSDLLRTTHGYHPVCFATPYEAAAWSILTQQTARGHARASWRRIIDAAGVRVEVDGREVDCFPDPRTVLSHAPEIRGAATRRRQAEYLLNAAETFSEELADPDCQWLDTHEIHAMLRAIPGVGPWSAEFVVARGFGLLDELHLVGPALRNAVSALYGRSFSDGQVLQRARWYSGAPAYWAHLIRAFGPAPDPD